ncbi:hypothetical protein ACQPXH_24045 [Nocardia sp. CA-135953]|uniref:hypothetical protein n=1 Tax=Nocardia sp. CA-135953 TaxID=3239978 RepID=UPI003D95C7DD
MSNDDAGVQRPPAAVELGHVKDSAVERVLVVNSPGGAIRADSVEGSSFKDITYINGVDSDDMTALITAVQGLNDPEATTLLEQASANPQDVDVWKLLITKVGKPAAVVALKAVHAAAALATIAEYCQTHGISV